jgi:hypothetical protein
VSRQSNRKGTEERQVQDDDNALSVTDKSGADQVERTQEHNQTGRQNAFPEVQISANAEELCRIPAEGQGDHRHADQPDSLLPVECLNL